VVSPEFDRPDNVDFFLATPPAPGDPALICYTSGTTGVPKGALLPHRKALYNCMNAGAFFGLSRDDRVLAVVPLFHSFGLAILSLPTLWAGGMVVLQPRFDASAVWRAVSAERITFLGGVPTMFSALLEAFDRERPDVSSVRFLFTAGAAIPVDLIHAFAARGLALKQGFGQTETSILCCLDAADAVRKAGSVGKPVPHAELRIVRRESLARRPAEWEDCPVGESGEIVVRGPITMTGYWERPEATAESLADAELHTGDLGFLDDDGYLIVTGRLKDIIIRSGENISARELEELLVTHSKVASVAVVARPDSRTGERACAFVVASDHAEPPSLTELCDYLIEAGLSRRKLPEQLEVTNALPMTAGGKVDKQALRLR